MIDSRELGAWATMLFVRWFGPRGLASIILGLVYPEHSADHPMPAAIHPTIVATEFISVYAHGLSAPSGFAACGRKIASLLSDFPEQQPPKPAAFQPSP